MTYTVGKGRPPKHSQFKKGQSGNPAGARAHNQILKRRKRILSPDVQCAVYDLLFASTESDLKRTLKDPRSSVLKLMIARVVEKAIKTGNFRAVDALVTWVIGPPPAAPMETPKSVFIISQEEMDELRADPDCAKAIEKLEESVAQIRGRTKARILSIIRGEI